MFLKINKRKHVHSHKRKHIRKHNIEHRNQTCKTTSQSGSRRVSQTEKLLHLEQRKKQIIGEFLRRSSSKKIHKPHQHSFHNTNHLTTLTEIKRLHLATKDGRTESLHELVWQ